MVLIDYDYNGEVFDLDSVHYAHDIERRLSVIPSISLLS